MTLPGVGNQTDFTRPVGVLTGLPVDPLGPGGTDIDLASSEVVGVLPEGKIDAALQRIAEKGQPDGYASLDASARLPDDQLPLSSLERFSTGRILFDGFTRLGGLNLRVGAGRGYRKKGPPSDPAPASVITVVWAQTDVVLPDNALRRVGIDEDGNVVVQAAVLDHETHIPLGTVRTSGGEIDFLSLRDLDLIQPIADLDTYLSNTVGGALASGMEVTEHNAPSLQVAVSTGTYYLAKDIKTAPAAAPVTFTLWFRDGAGGWSSLPGQTALDPDNWLDDGSGVLQAVPAGKHTNPVLFAAPDSNSTAEYHVVAAQQAFDIRAEAETFSFPDFPEEFPNQALRLAIVVCQQGVASIVSIVQVQPRGPSFLQVPNPGGFAPLDSQGQIPTAFLPASALQGSSVPGRHLALGVSAYTATGAFSAGTIQFTKVFLRSGLKFDRMEYYQSGGGGTGVSVRMGLYDQAVLDDIDSDPLNLLVQTGVHVSIAGDDLSFVRIPLASVFTVSDTAFYWLAIINTANSLKHSLTPVYPANFLPRREQASAGTTLPAVAGGLTNPSSSVVYAAALEE